MEGYDWWLKNEGHVGVPLDIHNPNVHRSTRERERETQGPVLAIKRERVRE